MSKGVEIPIKVVRLRGKKLARFIESENALAAGFGDEPRPIPPEDIKLSLFKTITAYCAITLLGASLGLAWYKTPAYLLGLSEAERQAKLPVAADRDPQEMSSLKRLLGLGDLELSGYRKVIFREHRISIPAIRLELPIVTAKTTEEDELLAALNEGPVLYPGNSVFGLPGNSVMMAHSTGEPWKGKYRFAFMNIDKLAPGDDILVDFGARRFTYKVTGKRIVTPAETTDLHEKTDSSRLVLVTCWPLWTAEKRLLVEADIVSVEGKPILAGNI